MNNAEFWTKTKHDYITQYVRVTRLITAAVSKYQGACHQTIDSRKLGDVLKSKGFIGVSGCRPDPKALFNRQWELYGVKTEEYFFKADWPNIASYYVGLSAQLERFTEVDADNAIEAATNDSIL